jgi:hypothetical protein
VQEANSWLPGFTVTAEDFVSLNSDLASAERKPDGSLPDIDFLFLAQGSDLIDAGVDLGYPFNGEAPDLGAFETDYLNSIIEYTTPGDFQLYGNYPNPFNPSTHIVYTLSKADRVTLIVYNALGQHVLTLVENELQSAGMHTVAWHGRDQWGNIASSGVYFYRLVTASGMVKTSRMHLLK